jgi:predicted RNA-binding protein with PIN domain
MCDGEGKEYNSIESLDKESLTDLNNLEKILIHKTYIKGNIISTEDIDTLDNLEVLNINITKNNYPNIFKWKKEIERMRLNWKISKKPPNIKGKTFKQYIEIQTNKLMDKNKLFDEQIKSNMKFHENILKPEEKEKEVATIHFFTKKSEGQDMYILKILIKFAPEINMTYKDLAPKILIICHNHLKNKTDIEEYKEGKEKENNIKCINIVITSLIETDDYNIENLASELKRNIGGISSVSILSLEKKENK